MCFLWLLHGRESRIRRGRRDAGHELLVARHRLVYGGGNVGLMGVLADAVLAGGRPITASSRTRLVARELAHRRRHELHVVHSMHERKALMAELSDGFVALPGGFGTLEEFCEA